MKRIKWNEGGGGIKSGKRHEDTCTLLVYAVSVFTVYWEKQLTGCQVQPGLQNLCDHLLPPLWPSDTRIYTSIYMYECVCVCVCVGGCVRACVCMCVLLTVGSYSVCVTKEIARNECRIWVRVDSRCGGWGMLPVQSHDFFHWPLFKWAALLWTARVTKKILKRSALEQRVIPASPRLPQLRAPLGGVAGQHGHRGPDSSNAQHLSSWQ